MKTLHDLTFDGPAVQSNRIALRQLAASRQAALDHVRTNQLFEEMTGCKTRALGESALNTRLEALNWFHSDRVYFIAGFDRRKDLVHFTATWPVEGGGAGHSRLGMPMKLALECAGDLAQAVTLH